MIPQALSTAPQEAFPGSMQSVPGRKLNESKTACSFLLFVYNTAIRRSDALNMVGISGGLQYKRQAQIHTCVRGLLSCNRFHTQMNPCTHTKQSQRKSLSVPVVCWSARENPGEAQSSLLCHVNLSNRQVSTRCKGSGAEKHFLSSSPHSRHQYSCLVAPITGSYSTVHQTRRWIFFFVFAVDLNSLCHSAVMYINTNPGGIMHVLYGANAGPKCIILWLMERLKLIT